MALKDEIKQTKPFRGAGDEAFIAIQRTADMLLREFQHLLREEAGLSPVQYNVLRILRGAGADGRTCSEIGERLVTRDPDVTRLLDRMEKRAWLERRRSTVDRRVVRAFITDAGLELVDRLDEPVDRYTRDRFKRVGAKHLRELVAILDEVRAE